MKKLTAEHLRNLLDYNLYTGEFHWRNPRRSVSHGARAGSPHPEGYWRIRVQNKLYLEHRLVWFYFYGKWPKSQIDHINGDRCDNRLKNLREATPVENSRNAGLRSDNKSGHKGVFYYWRTNKWTAYIRTDGKRQHLGYFATADEAKLAYAVAAKKYHGEFGRAV